MSEVIQMQSKINNLSVYTHYLVMVQAIHRFLAQKKYLQLDLPVLAPSLIPESYLEVFETTFTYLDAHKKYYLTPSPELFIKRLLADGVGDCYYLGKCFRNSEPHSPRHEPEFTMLEWYKVGENYRFMAHEVLSLLQFLAKEVCQSTDNTITYQGKHIDLTSWEELTVAEAFEQYAGISAEELFDHKLFAAKAQEKKYKTEGFGYEDLFSQIYTQEVEPHLGMNGKPTLLYDYPVEFAALSKPNDDGKTSQRFEFYISGLELGNCYSELTDWKLQETRFADEEAARKKSGKIEHPTDWGFIDALKKGLPNSTGIAIGVERLGMIFTNVNEIEKLKLISISN